MFKNTFKYCLITLSILLFSIISKADGLSLINVSEKDAFAVMKDFSSLGQFTTVNSAAGHGKLFGFDFGIVGGVGEYEETKKVLKNVPGGEEPPFGYAPFGWLSGSVTIPLGLTFEANYLPGIDIKDVEIDSFGIGLKWTLTDVIKLPIPLSIAGKVYYSQFGVDYKGSSSIPTGIAALPLIPANYSGSMSSKMTGLEAMVGFNKLPIFKPYLSLGFLMAENELSTGVDQNNPLFTALLPAQRSAVLSLTDNKYKDKPDSIYYRLGAQVKLLTFQWSLEFQRSFNNNRLATKFAFGF